MNQDIISKIEKLRELAKSSNISEATAAAIAADKLIAKYRISEQDLNNKPLEVEEDNNFIYESARSITWKHDLAVSLAEHYSCFIYNKLGYGKNGRAVTRLILTGTKSDMSIAKYMFTWLVFEIERLNKANKGLGHIACNSFCLGAVFGIKEQLAKSKQENLEQANKEGQGLALQKLDQRLIDAEALVKSKVKIKENNTKTKNYIQTDIYNNGIAAGKNIHLGKVMSGANTKLLKA